jgi:hypothetical protein
MNCRPQRSRIRVVLADHDRHRREGLRLSLLNSQLFDVVDTVASVEECNKVIEETVPELVVGPDEFVTANADEDSRFPLFILVGQSEREGKRITCRIPNGSDFDQTSKAFAIAASKVLSLKAYELSNLIAHYVQFSDAAPAYEALEVELHGTRQDLPIDDIYWIEAARNYVSIHARSGVFDAREPITKLATRLHRCGFVRVHRRAVVNSAMIAERITREGVLVGLCLTDGTQVPVGPLFRGQVAGTSHPKNASTPFG